MTILVDTAVWPWRGRRWAHLVSDTSFDELHDFAVRIGKRRVAFQGDHYDVDTTERDRAIEAGAVAVDPRELVRALRSAGLRRAPRTKIEPWRWVVDQIEVAGADDVVAAVATTAHHLVDDRFRDELSTIAEVITAVSAETRFSVFTKSTGAAAMLASVEPLDPTNAGERAVRDEAVSAISSLGSASDRWWLAGHGRVVAELVVER